MKVYAIHDPERQSSRVYVESHQNEDGTRVFVTRIGGPKVQYVPLGAEPPLYMDPIPDDIATALAEALAPRPVATERHLDDAIGMRDRLFRLVEMTVARGT